MADNALYGLPQQYRGQNALMSGQQEPVMRSYQEPWYRALPNRLTDYIYGPDATAQQAAGVRHLVGPENPLNLPGQFSEGVDTARTGYQLGNNLMTGLGALQAMTALPIPGAKVAGQVAKQEAKGIRAYHGSPHDFDKFDASKIGTGEGAQAYGHGLYFAENEGVAKSYRDGLSFNDTKPEHLAADAMRRAGGDRQKAAALVKSEMTEDMKIYEGEHYQRMLRARGLIERGEDIPQIPKGSMYEVRINADPSNFLDWDKPLGQQTPTVRAALEKTGALGNPDPFHAPYQMADGTWRVSNAPTNPVIPDGRPAYAGYHDSKSYATEAEARAAAERMQADVIARNPLTGQDAYENIRKSIGGKPAATDALKQHGVAGIQYLDGGSRAAGDGTRNYVVFDPATIEILRKYGLLGLMSGSVAAGAMPQQSNTLYGGQ